jgi:NAD(P)-dependent dehydrogenase (short-subunit alcohol dehydrogenase family)
VTPVASFTLPRVPSSPTAVVTGAASGLGRALARELHARGVMVVIADVDEERGRAVAAELAGSRFVGTDVRRFEDVEAAVATAVREGGRIDWMINNAGVGVLGEARDMEARHWQRVVDINVLGVAHGVQAAYPRMAAQGSGRILNMASIAGVIPTPTGAAYSASKHAVIGLSLALRMEAKSLGVSVTAACPSFIRTRFGDSAEYLRVDRATLFPAAVENEEQQARAARRILDAAERGRALVFIPRRMRLAWWAWRMAPWLCEATIGAIAVRRHRRVRGHGADGSGS